MVYAFASTKEGPNLCLTSYAGFCTLGGDVVVVGMQGLLNDSKVLNSVALDDVNHILLAPHRRMFLVCFVVSQHAA